MVPACAILSLGLFLCLVLRSVAVPFGLVLAFFATSNKKLFCEMMEHPWCLLDVSWWVLVGFRLFFDELWGSRWSPRFGWSPGADGPAGLRFHYDLLGF